MGDIITVRCVLARGKFHSSHGTCDALAFVGTTQGGRPWHWIACHEKGAPGLPDADPQPQWEYEIRDGRLHFTPSLLDKSDQFHTDFHWSVEFAELPPERGAHDFFFEINPDVKP